MCHPVGHGFWGFPSLNRVLIFICLILKYGEGFRLIKNKQESEISRSNVSPKLTMLSSRSFVVILVKKFPAFQPQGACEARVQQSDDSKSWLEILDKSWAWLEILTRNSNSKGERMCSFSPLLEILTRTSTRNTNSRSASKIGQPSCAWLTLYFMNK